MRVVDLADAVALGLPADEALFAHEPAEPLRRRPRTGAVGRGVEMYRAGGVTLAPRSRAEIARFFEGLEPVAPGLVQLTEWHPELAHGETTDEHAVISLYGAVARKP